MQIHLAKMMQVALVRVILLPKKSLRQRQLPVQLAAAVIKRCFLLNLLVIQLFATKRIQLNA